ncbi:DNA-directed RNA polymerase specialized sigma subunit [Micromonospora sp. M71_S20]|uniref:hypothetical protein n=1 Tax=Micromonospora sp. M71_S20 TaxID=592872 RepID=UPI000EAC3C5F|nr:hypothetical protein [Micromonospora sp. M71_S20]RLK22671.1 DNA-directed RNA polymerase specialized sigma subunit [Micromonospora sp. M71_S20]
MSAFAQLWTVTTTPLDVEEEPAVIAAAQAGDEAATLRLFAAYQPALRAAVKQSMVGLGGRMTRDDAQQAATLGFLEALRVYRPDAETGGRLAAFLRHRLADEMTLAASDMTGGFSVPSRTLRRFFGIMARADRDPVEAARIAPDFEMSEETFWLIWTAVRAESSLEEAVEIHGDADRAAPVGDASEPRGVADAEDRVLCDLAFRAVDDFERDVCRLAYGFADFDPQPDAEIGHRLGGFSRLKVQRTRTRALGKMRSALGALND